MGEEEVDFGLWIMDFRKEKVDFRARKRRRKLKRGFNFGWPLEREREREY